MANLTKIRFLTYEKRIRADLDALFAEAPDAAEQVFNKEYVQTLRTYVDQIEGWEIRLFLFSTGVLFLLIVGLISSDNSVSIFGASFKNATGLKEALMVMLTSAGLAATMLSYAKEIRLVTLKYLRKRLTDPRFEDFVALADRTALHVNLYISKPSAR